MINNSLPLDNLRKDIEGGELERLAVWRKEGDGDITVELGLEACDALSKQAPDGGRN